MFLKSVPPAVAIHSDWRSVGSVSSVGGGPPQSLGLPLCFNDSDSSLSSSGTPIHHKVQMIIESLRTTQSSVDMSDGGQMEGTGSAAHSSRELLRQPGRKVKTSSSGLKGAVAAAAAGTMECQPPPPHHPCPIPESQDSDSDSDSSVDRGIEEAIQEYLKEKVDHKRKAEPSPVSTRPAVKIPRRDTIIVAADTSRPQSCSDGNKVLTASNHIPLKNYKGAITPVANQKKKLKKKRPSKENPVKKPAVTMLSFFKKLPSKDQRGASSTLPHPDRVQPPLVTKAEEAIDASSSSSDDGIEEEIQRYQQQKSREQLQLSRPQTLKEEEEEEEEDSSSDDGIEEAIRRFQQEKKQKEKIHQKKRKSMVKQLKLKHTSPGAKVGLLSTDRTELTSGKKALKPTNSGPTKKKKKKCKTEGKLSVPGFSPDRPASLGSPSSDSFNGRGHFVSPSRPEPTPVPILKVNTTAELMCAEAILDISKAVMPMTFDPNPQPLDTALIVPTAIPLPSLSLKDLSEAESSVDSEDGIELEIRRFLEQKAQMQKETASTPAAVQEAPKTTFTPKPPTDSEKGDHSEDKSSSLDSDEDLDAAIKDLLKTKKRVKKKRKKGPAKSQAESASIILTQPSSKHKQLSDTSGKNSKSGPSKTAKKKSSQVKNKKPLKVLKSSSEAKQEKKGKTPSPQAKAPRPDPTEDSRATGTGIQTDSMIFKVEEKVEEDSSSVDSDDSIEQEIRKFLAEKAKVGNTSTVSTASTFTSSSASIPTSTPPAAVKAEEMEPDRRHLDQNHSKATSPPRAVKLEGQQAEIPLDVGAVCPEARQGVWQKHCESSRNSLSPTGSSGHSAWDGPTHSAPVNCKEERKWSAEERRPPSVGSPPRDKPHELVDCGTPYSRTQTHTPGRTPGSSRSSPSRSHCTPSSPDEIPSTQTMPCHARPSILATAASLPGLGSSSHPSTDPCICPTSFPAVTFYRSSTETPVSRGGLPPLVCVSDRQPQAGGKRRRWDQPPASQPQACGGSASIKTPAASPGQSAPHVSRHPAGGRQEREGKEEGRGREGETEVIEVKKEEESELVDETDLDSEEEERRLGEWQRESRQQRFPSVSLERTIDPGMTMSPYIALNTEERCRKACNIKTQKYRPVKRKLQFVVCANRRETTGK